MTDTSTFDDGDLADLWDDGDYSRENYTEPTPSAATVAEIEAALGYRLPDSYVELCGHRNGGMLARSGFPLSDPAFGDGVVSVTGIYAIGRDATWSLGGRLGSAFMLQEWGYPAIGICFADTPSGGHEQLMLDYRACGPEGEPTVVHVDQEGDYRITPIAPDFATFVRGHIDEDELEDPAADLAAALDVVRHGTFSPVVVRAIEASGIPEAGDWLRALAERVVREKGFWSHHADPSSYLVYDALFWLYSHLATAQSFDDFAFRADGQVDYERPCYELMITTSFVADPYGFATGGWAPGFVEEWWATKVAGGAITETPEGYRFTPEYAAQLVRVLRAVASTGRG